MKLTKKDIIEISPELEYYSGLQRKYMEYFKQKMVEIYSDDDVEISVDDLKGFEVISLSRLREVVEEIHRRFMFRGGDVNWWYDDVIDDLFGEVMEE